MKKFIVTALMLCCILFTGPSNASSAHTPGHGAIKAATKKCEADVGKLCTQDGGTCHQFCEAINANSTSKAKTRHIENCKRECTVEKRCKLKPVGGNDTPGNKELEAQTREQLVACIAEIRDPKGTKSGRDMSPWQERETHSWKKLMEATKKAEAKKEASAEETVD